MRQFVLAALLLFLTSMAAIAQDTAPEPEAAAQGEIVAPAEEEPAEAAEPEEQSPEEQRAERARNTIETLAPLIRSRETLQARIKAQVAKIEAAADAEKEALAEELKLLNEELAGVEDQISIVATGVSERQYRQSDMKEFDLQTELENLVQPFVTLLLGATEEARQIEATRRALGETGENIESAETALENVEASMGVVEDAAVLAELEERRALWLERLETARSQEAALSQQLEDLLTERVTAGSQVQSAMKGFFRERGLSLLLGVLAFITVMMACRLAARLVRHSMERTRRERTFYTRLFGLIFAGFTVAASFAAMLIVFNLRNDWLLLGLATVLLIALIWIGIRMLPGLIEQATVLLNMGAVQENERVLFNGVPFLVRRLSFYTDLVNPALDGGEFTIPVREMVGLYSRPAAQNEAWFPSLKGDWVRLADGHAGHVVAQTPEMVVVELLGGARVTYQTSDYLAQVPENLSHGYRVECEFGIDYRHQAQATDEIITQMRDGVAARMTAFLGEEHVRDVEVEFLRAGASSLDFEVEVDVAGTAAERFEEVERELARVLVALATEHGWEIPFQQMVIHQQGQQAGAA